MNDYAFESLTLSCTDSNNDGLLDFDVGIAWIVQKGKYDCDINDPDKAPVASSYPKCWYDQNERILCIIFCCLQSLFQISYIYVSHLCFNSLCSCCAKQSVSD